MATKPATKQPRKKKTMKFGEDLGQPKRRPSSGRPKKENGSRKKRSEESHEDEDHYDDKICVLCCEEIEFFAKGSCDHVVCFRCSSRMRALCDEMYCAVCRLELKKVSLSYHYCIIFLSPIFIICLPFSFTTSYISYFL